MDVRLRYLIMFGILSKFRLVERMHNSEAIFDLVAPIFMKYAIYIGVCLLQIIMDCLLSKHGGAIASIT